MTKTPVFTRILRLALPLTILASGDSIAQQSRNPSNYVKQVITTLENSASEQRSVATPNNLTGAQYAKIKKGDLWLTSGNYFFLDKKADGLVDKVYNFNSDNLEYKELKNKRACQEAYTRALESYLSNINAIIDPEQKRKELERFQRILRLDELTGKLAGMAGTNFTININSNYPE